MGRAQQWRVQQRAHQGVLNKDVSYGVKEVLGYSEPNNDVSKGVLNQDVLYGVLDNQTGEQKGEGEDWQTCDPSASVLSRSYRHRANLACLPV